MIAPYAVALALMVTPEAACAQSAAAGRERLLADDTASMKRRLHACARCRAGQRRGRAVVHGASPGHDASRRSRYLLLDRPMQQRFESDPMFQATMLLLQERIPKPRPSTRTADARRRPRAAAPRGRAAMRVFARPDTRVPEVQLLSNGRYHVMVTNAGGGYSRWKDLAVTRWREDATAR